MLLETRAPLRPIEQRVETPDEPQPSTAPLAHELLWRRARPARSGEPVLVFAPALAS